jgi:hypothetical protein
MAGRVPTGLKVIGWSPAEGRRFALPVGFAFLALAALLGWRGLTSASWVAGSLGVLLLLAGIVAPAHLGPVHRVWMRLAHALSRVTTPIFLGVVYFLVITPIALLMRISGRNPLVHRSTTDTCYWIARTASGGRTKSDLERQF